MQQVNVFICDHVIRTWNTFASYKLHLLLGEWGTNRTTSCNHQSPQNRFQDRFQIQSLQNYYLPHYITSNYSYSLLTTFGTTYTDIFISHGFVSHFGPPIWWFVPLHHINMVSQFLFIFHVIICHLLTLNELLMLWLFLCPLKLLFTVNADVPFATK